ncbi:MAG: HEAT repeat domain-containing protein [Verrucomicrobia bacterium]|nr:HEAT repeat domain-containing protein [Verrucomicrobiota bacterium]
MKPIRSLLLVSALVALPAVASAAAAKKAAAEAIPKLPPMSEAQALAVLNSDAGVQEKARACQELGNYGGPKSVSALAALLDQEHLGDYARSGLENIPDASAGKALRDALPRLKDRQLAGAINSLGVRRDGAAVAELQKLALDPKRGAGTEAVASLGLIGNADAAKALQQVLASGPADLRTPAAHAALVAAEHLTQAGNAAVARKLLDAVTKALPSSFVAETAKKQAAALKGR